jgi:hypothetical protein
VTWFAFGEAVSTTSMTDLFGLLSRLDNHFQPAMNLASRKYIVPFAWGNRLGRN